MNEKISGLLDPKMWEMSEEYKEKCRQRVHDFNKRHLSGMLTYDGVELSQIRAPRMEMIPERRKGFFGRIKDRILGPVMKPLPAIVLTKEERELLKMYMENPQKVNSVVNACAVTADEIKDACDKMVVLARGHHIRNDDGTVTDVSDDPSYECQE